MVGRGRFLRRCRGFRQVMAAKKKSEKQNAQQPVSSAELAERLRRLAKDDEPGWRLGARIRNYFLTGLIIVGPLGITLYMVWSFVHIADTWIKPWLPASYLPETYLPFAVPGIGLMFGIAGVTIIGALAANLLGRTLISFGELMFEGMPIVRNIYRALKHVFEGVVTASGPNQSFQQVGIIEFPSKGLWSLVFVTSDSVGEIGAVKPGGEEDMIAVFMPTGVVPPTGFICFVPRASVTILDMTTEDAAKIIISAGMVIPDHKVRMEELAEGAVPPAGDGKTP